MTDQRFGLTEGLVIAGVPAAGYWFAFLYELGYCKYFDIPPAFIEIGILNILVAIIGLGGAFALIHLYADPVFVLSRRLAKPIRRALLRISLPVVLFAGYALVVRLTFIQFILVLALFFVPLAFFEFIFPLITQRNISGYLNKLDAQNRIELEHDTLMDLVAMAVGRKIFLFSGFLLMVSFVSYFTGGYEAKTQRDFMVISEQPERVVLKRNSGYFVVARFEREKKSISKDFALVSTEQELFQFNYERVGPLLPDNLESSSRRSD
jgi:hypothetical protein